MEDPQWVSWLVEIVPAVRFSFSILTPCPDLCLGPPAGIATGGSSSGGGGFGGPPGLSCDPDAIQDVKAGLGFGNERSVTRFNGDGSLKFGAPIKPGDRCKFSTYSIMLEH